MIIASRNWSLKSKFSDYFQDLSNLIIFFCRNKIAVTNDETQEKMREWEAINQKLKSELKSATEQLIVKGNDLTSSKQELQRHRNEIDVSLFLSKF